MASISVAAGWQLLGNCYYQKQEIYSMQWKHMDLGRNKIACAPFGGPIAVIRDDSKIVQLYSESSLRKLRIFNSAGLMIAETTWNRPGGRLIGMSWTETLLLVCIVQDGTIYRFDIHANGMEPNFKLGYECFEQNVVDCAFWGSGVICLTGEGKLFCVSDLSDFKPYKLADVETGDTVHCMAVIEPKYTLSGNPELLLGVSGGIVLVDENEVKLVNTGAVNGAMQKLAFSWDGKYLAGYMQDGSVVVMKHSDIPLEFDVLFIYHSETVLPPGQMVWCGSDSIVLCRDDMIQLVGPSKECLSYIYEEPTILVPECDGVRILSNSRMEFLTRVPDSVESIFRIGSTSPASLLFDALIHFDQRSAKADENLRLIHSSLPEAIDACIEAAGYEFDISRQQTLLRAGSYGQSFCSTFPRDRIREMCRTLRVLNAVRCLEIGVPLSIQQYKLLTAPVLVARLINFHKHLLALRLSEYLGLSKEIVIMHWACTMIEMSLDVSDEVLLEIILDKLSLSKDISYAAVAAHADRSGYRKLAAMLVNHEPRSSKQVPLLLSIEEYESALDKAIESHDTDLVYLALFHIWKKKPLLELFSIIHGRPVAKDLFVIYARSYKREILKDYYLSAKMFHEVAFLLWNESWQLPKTPVAGKGSMHHSPRLKQIEKAHRLFSETKEHDFERKATEEHVKLLRMQHELEAITKQAVFIDSSVNDTIRTCIVLGYHDAALKVKTELKIADKRWYWLKAFALATIRDWITLEKFSKEKRPPFGFRPFVEACIEANEKDQALKYIVKLPDPRERAEAYARIGMSEEAASQENDGELLGRLKLNFAQNTSASSIFDTLKERFSFQSI